MSSFRQPVGSRRVPAADAFFLHVESPIAAQQVGGLVLLDASSGVPAREAVAGLVRSRLAQLPRFRQRIWAPSRWRTPRWVGASELDWAWHVTVRDLPGPGARAALERLVAELLAEPLPRDRPLWRLVLVPQVEPHQAAAVLILHHVIADGIGAVHQALRLLDPVAATGAATTPAGGAPARRRPVRTTLATVTGLGQLATDGRPRWRIPTSGSRTRRFGTADLPLAQLRSAARRHQVRPTEVLLSAVAGGLHRLRPELFAAPRRERLRTLVPLMVRVPDSPAEGNLTGAVLLDLPVGRIPEVERLARTIRYARGLRTGTRVAASGFVMRSVGQLLPAPVHRWGARTVYGGRFFQAIVSNMPGPDTPLSLAGAPLLAAYPVVPLAPGAPLAVGALGWHGTLHLGISADPALLDEPAALGAAVRAVVDELTQAAPASVR